MVPKLVGAGWRLAAGHDAPGDPTKPDEATWKENFITLVRDYLISATLVARPAVWVDDSDRLSHSEVAINVRYRDQVARGERRQKIRFSLEHALIGSTWYLTKVQILDKPPG